VLTRGDRVVFRAFSPPVTIGGGVVLDPLAPAGGVRRAAALDRFTRLSDDRHAPAVWLTEAGGRGVDPQRFVPRGGLTPDGARAAADALVAAGQARRAAGRLFDPAVAAAIEHGVLAELAAFHRSRPLEPGASREAIRETVAPSADPALFDAVIEDLVARHVAGGTDRLALATHRPTLSPRETQARSVLLEQVRIAGLTPPDASSLAAVAGLDPAALDRLVQMLVRERALVRIDAWVFHPEALAALKSSIQALRLETAGPPTVDVGTFKARFGLSRKFAIPLLEWLDRERVTRRVGDRRLVI
jgi:selenocysteine-specific elongation factor